MTSLWVFLIFLVYPVACTSSFLFQVSSNETFVSISPFDAALQSLQKRIGYQFERDDLLQRAMTHPSYSGDNFRALHSLGIAAIQSTMALRLLKHDLDVSPKDLNQRIEQAAGTDACYEDAYRLGLDKVVRVSKKTNSSAPRVICDAFRAMFGAVSVDAGSVDAAGKVFWNVHFHGVYGVSNLFEITRKTCYMQRFFPAKNAHCVF